MSERSTYLRDQADKCQRHADAMGDVRNRTFTKCVVRFAFGGICMPSSKYYREQAKVLAGLALSTNDPTETNRFKLAAMEHLERAQALDDANIGPPAPTNMRIAIK